MMARYGGMLDVLDRLALAVFCVEIAAKLYVRRLRFFKDPWNACDFVVVASGMQAGINADRQKAVKEAVGEGEEPLVTEVKPLRAEMARLAQVIERRPR